MPGGRPSSYKPEYAEMAYKLSLLSLTDKQMAEVFDTTEQTVNNWKKEHPEFFESLKKGKAIADAEVVASFIHRAKGYSHPEDKIFLHEGKPVIVPTTKHYPPDTAAGFIWLKNRQGWRDKQEVEHSGKLEYDLTLPAELTPQKLASSNEDGQEGA